MSTRLVAAAFSLFALSTPAAFAQAPQPAATPLEREVVVTAGSQEDAVRAFVGDVAQEVRGENQLARWDRRICPGFSGLKPAMARAMIDRIARRAFEVGLDVGAPGCKANIFIAVTMDAQALTKDLVDNNREVLGYHSGRGRRTMGRDALMAFVASDAPVRWWHVSDTVTAKGQSTSETVSGDAPTVSVDEVSRISRSTRLDFAGVVVVVDARRIDGLPLSGLADYVAMVSLAQLDPRTDTSRFPTILNLFAGGGDPAVAPPTTLTAWDLAYLRGLYEAPRDARAERQQVSIAQTMTRSLPPQ